MSWLRQVGKTRWRHSLANESFFGTRAEHIVRYAEANHIDHIVVGHRGHTLFERWLIGSVARQGIA
jgi:nucleotide-binding universal stress UspA family protein